jgi:tetratricopeptide (TPR) repeat protein
VGQFAAAEQLGRQVLVLSPRDAEGMTLVAISLQARSRHAEAAKLLERLVQLEPTVAAHWVNLGTVLRAAGRLDEALAAYERSAALGACGTDFLYNVGLLQIDRGDYEAARLVLREAHRGAPRDAEISYQYAAACSETYDMQEGLAALEGWPGFMGLTTELVAKIAGLLVKLGSLDQADAAIARVLADPHPSIDAQLKLVLALERVNRLDQAEQLLARVPEAAATIPGSDTLLLLARARLAERRGNHAAAVDLFRRLVNEKADAARKHLHLYPLAKSLDLLGRCEEAFAALLEAHASQSLWTEQTAPEVVERKSDTMRVTRFGCDPADVERWNREGAPSFLESPIFIVAFPRSGTTLLEQVLDAHPRLRSMDEQPYLQNAIEKLSVDGAHYPERMAPLTPAQLQEARDYYWSLVRQRVMLAPGEQLIDKNPLNILRLPAITRMFPNARVLLAVRHPCDVLLSCFMQHFRTEFAWHCRDVPTLALAYRRSFDFWYEQAALLRPSVLEVRYESFVANFEGEVREVARFLDLPWTDAMLEPGEHARRKGFISTPSYSQVVQPVHLKSIDRWRAYERHLLPAVPELQGYLERWGYAGPGQNSR